MPNGIAVIFSAAGAAWIDCNDHPLHVRQLPLPVRPVDHVARPERTGHVKQQLARNFLPTNARVGVAIGNRMNEIWREICLVLICATADYSDVLALAA